MHHDSESLSTHKKSENEYLNPRECIEELEKIKNKFLDAYDKQENDLDNYNNTYLNHKNSGFGL